MIKQITLLIVLSLMTFSCDYPVFNHYYEEEPSVAVSSFFCPDSIFKVKVIPLFDVFSNKTTNVWVDHLRVINLKSGDEFVLDRIDDNIYSNETLKAVLGDIFKIEIKINAIEELIVAKDSIGLSTVKFEIIEKGMKINNKEKTDVDRTGILKMDKTTMKINHCYEILVSTNLLDETVPMSKELIKQPIETTAPFITSEDYYPSNTDIDFHLPASLLFTCKDNSNDLIVDFVYNPGMGIGGGMGTHIPEHLLHVEVREVSLAYYQYKTALYKQRNVVEGDIIYGAASPVIIPSNVKNGTGVFAGYTSSMVSTIVEGMFIK